jgi:L-histidine N-alpha-methyltransferase
MHLVSTRRQSVEIPGIGQIRFGHGESIRTEISCKYDIPSIAALFSAAGLRLESWTTDPGHRFALVVGGPA